MRANRTFQWEDPPAKSRRLNGPMNANQSKYIPSLVKISKHPGQWARIAMVTVKNRKEKVAVTGRLSSVGTTIRRGGFNGQPVGNWDVICRSPEPNVIGLWVRFTPVQDDTDNGMTTYVN